MNKKIIASISALTLLVPFTTSCNKHNMGKIREQYHTFIHDTTDIDDYKDKSIDEIKSELITVPINGIDTYKFKDVDYTTDWIRSDWPAREHLARTLEIAIIAEDRNSEELRDIAKKLTYHWVFSNYRNINWWHNELGAIPKLANIGFFTFDYIGRKGQDALDGKVREASLKYRPAVSTHTGANLFDYVDTTVRDAVLNNDEDEMNIAFKRLQEEIVDTKEEGFQKDGTFFQHGKQVQNVSYGKAVIRIAKILHCIRDSGYELPDEKLQILSDYILRGLRASTFKGYINYTTISRAYDRANYLDSQTNTDSSLDDLKYLKDVNRFPGKEDILNYVNTLKEHKESIKQDTIFYFPIGKMIVANIGHRDGKDGIYLSYKGTAPEIVNTECNNGENQLGLNLSYGTNTCVMDTGKEYFNIAPILDYENMPGTTSVTYGDGAQEAHDAALVHFAKDVYNDSTLVRKVPNATDENGFVYADGQQDDVTYMMTRTKHHDRAKYTVTCFTTTDGMVLVGSDFGYTSIGGEDVPTITNMHTTLDQYITDDGPSTITNQSTIKNHSNGNVKYTMLDSNTISKTIASYEYDEDDWKRNHPTYKDGVKGSANVATIKLDGDNTSTYAYAIEPYSEGDSKFKLAFNANSIHAVELPNGKIAAAFYSKNNLSFTYLDKTYSITTDEFVNGKGAFKIFDK